MSESNGVCFGRGLRAWFSRLIRMTWRKLGRLTGGLELHNSMGQHEDEDTVAQTTVIGLDSPGPRIRVRGRRGSPPSRG